ncbi:hypothetical protein ACFL2H_00940, partial [Planctomycetota bacterium]
MRSIILVAILASTANAIEIELSLPVGADINGNGDVREGEGCQRRGGMSEKGTSGCQRRGHPLLLSIVSRRGIHP